MLERCLGGGTALMLIVVLVGVVRGRSELPELRIAILAHLLTIIVALALGIPLLLQKRGTQVHRTLGWAWTVSMLSTAVICCSYMKVVRGSSAQSIYYHC